MIKLIQIYAIGGATYHPMCGIGEDGKLYMWSISYYEGVYGIYMEEVDLAKMASLQDRLRKSIADYDPKSGVPHGVVSNYKKELEELQEIASLI